MVLAASTLVFSGDFIITQSCAEAKALPTAHTTTGPGVTEEVSPRGEKSVHLIWQTSKLLINYSSGNQISKSESLLKNYLLYKRRNVKANNFFRRTVARHGDTCSDNSSTVGGRGDNEFKANLQFLRDPGSKKWGEGDTVLWRVPLKSVCDVLGAWLVVQGSGSFRI